MFDYLHTLNNWLRLEVTIPSILSMCMLMGGDSLELLIIHDFGHVTDRQTDRQTDRHITDQQVI